MPPDLPPDRFAGAALADAEEPVRRYLTHALAEGAPIAGATWLAMTGHIRLGAWVPFTAEEECDGRSFRWRARLARGALQVVDEFADGRGRMRGRLFGRATLFDSKGTDVTRSAAGRAALEAIWCPAALLPRRGVTWQTVGDDEIVAAWDVGPERPEVHLRIGPEGAVREVWADRWGAAGRGRHDYVRCGCRVEAERAFGPLTLPSHVTVSWGQGPDERPFFRATVTAARPAG